MKKLFSVLLTLLILVSLLSACTGAATPNGEGGTGTPAEGTGDALVIYCNANFPPFEYMDGNEMAGVDIDLAKAIGEKLGREVDLQNVDFDGIIMALASGKCDLAISGITITDERKEQVDFSDPYIKSVQYLILPKDSEIATMEDLAEKKVGTPVGYTGQFVMDDEIDDGVLKNKNTEIVTYKNAVDGSLDVLNGRIDAVIMDEYVAKSIAAENEGLTAIRLIYADGSDIAEEYGVAFQKGQDDMKASINEVIAELTSQGKIEEWVIQHSSNQ